MTEWIIYCHMHIETRRCYVGLTSQTMAKRWKNHVYAAKYSKNKWHFPNAIRKYGKEAFSHRVLEICTSLEEANLREEAWIELFETRDPQFGFNLAKGGKHNSHIFRKNPWDNQEYRAKMLLVLSNMADTNRGRTFSLERRTEISEISKGRVLSQETKLKLAASNKGRKLTEEAKKKIGDKTKEHNRIYGRKGRKSTEETKNKISSKIKEYLLTHDRIGPFKGKNHSQETRDLISIRVKESLNT
jgi:group I intron endonuclease